MSFIAGGLIIGGGLAAAGSLGGALIANSGEKYSPEDYLIYKELPGYKESDIARGDWASKINEWGKDPNYGAIPMNWDEIWNTAKDKLNRYYWGGVNDTGLAGKVKASAARRGVSQSPALENQLATLGFQQGIDMNAMATEEATNKAKFAESGRNTWLNSMMNLAGLKPSYVTGTGAVGNATSYGMGNAIGDVSSGIGELFSQYAQGQMLQKENQQRNDYFSYLNGYGGGMPGTAQTSLMGNVPVAPPNYYLDGGAVGLPM